MASSETENQPYLLPGQAFSNEELAALVDRIRASGELGRSRVYAALLDYLLDCSANGSTPKEIEIAIEVLGKGVDFDVTRDAAVRVYIHQLRKKLDSYYRTHEPEAAFRIVIPKGQYAIAAIASQPPPPVQRETPQNRNRFGTGRILLTLVAVLLLANLAVSLIDDNTDELSGTGQAGTSRIWQSLLEDEVPILLVMGDYYIFGELNETGNIGRMVRDFSINSREDLEQRHFNDWDTTHNYQDLNLSYMPEGSAFALTRIIPILSASGKRINVTMMSDVTTAELRDNHVVYVGYISALDKLSDLVFRASRLQVGRSYDELIDSQTGRYYTSDAGLPEEGQQFHDYGFFKTFPAGSDNQIVVIAGMRDAGLMFTAQALSDPTRLKELEQQLDGVSEVVSLQALYQVYGVNRTHFDGTLVYSEIPDPALIWRQNLIGY